MLEPKQIPAEVLGVFQKACDSGEPWSIGDTFAAALNAWPGMRDTSTEGGEPHWQHHLILPLPKEGA